MCFCRVVLVLALCCSALEAVVCLAGEGRMIFRVIPVNLSILTDITWDRL